MLSLFFFFLKEVPGSGKLRPMLENRTLGPISILSLLAHHIYISNDLVHTESLRYTLCFCFQLLSVLH